MKSLSPQWLAKAIQLEEELRFAKEQVSSERESAEWLRMSNRQLQRALGEVTSELRRTTDVLVAERNEAEIASQQDDYKVFHWSEMVAYPGVMMLLGCGESVRVQQFGPWGLSMIMALITLAAFGFVESKARKS